MEKKKKKVEKREATFYTCIHCNFQGVCTCLRPEARPQGGPAWAVVRVVV